MRDCMLGPCARSPLAQELHSSREDVGGSGRKRHSQLHSAQGATVAAVSPISALAAAHAALGHSPERRCAGASTAVISASAPKTSSGICHDQLSVAP